MSGPTAALLPRLTRQCQPVRNASTPSSACPERNCRASVVPIVFGRITFLLPHLAALISRVKVKLAYGQSHLTVDLPDKCTTIIEPAHNPGLPDEKAAVLAVLEK